MTNIIWYVNKERQELLDKLTELPEYGKRKRSELIEMALKEFLQKHGQSNNPQTKLGMYDRETVNSVPHIYRDEDVWKRFYSLITKRDDFAEVDNQLNMILKLHNRRDKEIGV